ncbi:MAG: hypothetical protein AAFX99_35515 [Myxococcota bacterium]
MNLLAAPQARQSIIQTTAELLRQGVTPIDLLNAVFHAPILTASDYSDVHVVLVTDAIRVLTHAGTPHERLMPLFWVMAFASEWVQPGTLAPPSQTTTNMVSADEGQERLFQAFDARNQDAADSAVAALVEIAGLERALDALAVGGCIACTDPHRMIYVAQAARGLGVFGDKHAKAVLRSVARHMARSATPRQDNILLAHHTLHGRDIPAPPLGDNSESDEASTRLLWSYLREHREHEVGDLIGEMLVAGVPVEAVWDAIILTALESLMADTSISGMGVHLTTLVDALCFAYARATNIADRRVILLQSAAWAARLSQIRQPLDPMTPLAPPDNLNALKQPSEEVHRRTLGLAQTEQGRIAFIRRLITSTTLGAMGGSRVRQQSSAVSKGQ